jgi:hypothetical protein
LWPNLRTPPQIPSSTFVPLYHAVKLNITLASKPTYWRSSRRSAPCWNIKLSFFILKLLNYMKEVTLENTTAKLRIC